MRIFGVAAAVFVKPVCRSCHVNNNVKALKFATSISVTLYNYTAENINKLKSQFLMYSKKCMS